MCSVQPLREFIRQRLTAAAEEIFSEVEKTIIQYQEEIDRQRLLDISSQRADVPQSYVSTGAVLTEQQLCNLAEAELQRTKVELDESEHLVIKEEWEEPEPLQLEEESGELGVHQDKAQPNPVNEEMGHSESELNRERLLFQNSGEGGIMLVKTKIENEQNCVKIEQPSLEEFLNPDSDPAEEKERREDKKKRRKKKKEMRHKEVMPEEMHSLADDTEEVNTKKTTKWAVRTLRDFLAEKNMDIDFESYSASTLNNVLRLFYESVQPTKGGGEYSVASLKCLRASINRHLRDVNIIGDTRFRSSNVVFKAVLKRCQKNGKDTVCRYPRIPESDLKKIRRSSALSPDTPLGLVRKVWFDIQLCLACRGRQVSRELTTTSFRVQRGKDGVEYVSLGQYPNTANQKDPDHPQKRNRRGFMFARPEDPLCPVKSFKKYISKCPPDAKFFYLHPKRSIDLASDVWYSKEPMGVNYLGDMLKKISEEVGLSRVYTNQSLRSAAVGRLYDTVLDPSESTSDTESSWKQPVHLSGSISPGESSMEQPFIVLQSPDQQCSGSTDVNPPSLS